VIREDAAISYGNCKIEWSNGGAERNMDELWRQIDQIVENNLSATPEGMEFDVMPALTPSPETDLIQEPIADPAESQNKIEPETSAPSPVSTRKPGHQDIPEVAHGDEQEMSEGSPPTPFISEDNETDNAENSADFGPSEEDRGTPPSPSDPGLSAQSESGSNPTASPSPAGVEDASVEPDAEAGILSNTPDVKTPPSSEQPA